MLADMSGQTNVEYRVDIYNARHIEIASRRFHARNERAALAAGAAMVTALGGAHGTVLVLDGGREEYVDSVEATR